MERTYAAANIPRRGNMYEAQAAGHFFIWSDDEPLFDVLTTSRRVIIRHALSASMVLQVRQLNSDSTSSPVRTPSLKPRITFHRRSLTRLTPTVVDPAHPPIDARARLTVIQLSVAHYSNGQSGCTFLDENPAPVAECADPTPTPPSASRGLNTRDGSFSTQYVRLQWNSRTFQWQRREPWGWDWEFGAGVDWHLPSFIPGALEDDLRDLYGSVRAQGEVAWTNRWNWTQFGRDHAMRGQVRFLMEPVFVRPPGIPWFSGALEGFIGFDQWSGGGLFVRYHWGQDYYNIAFAREYEMVQFGLTFNSDRGRRIGG